MYQWFGNSVPNTKNIVNLSNCEFSTSELVLSYRLNFYQPPITLKRKEVFVEFEVRITQLEHRKFNRLSIALLSSH